MLRRIVERFSRGVVLRRRLPSRWGSGILYVSPESGGLKYWKRNLLAHDPALFLAVEQFVRPGDSVWDVGANVGLFTFAAAYRTGNTGTVLAIEPDLDNANLLLRSRRVMDRQTYAAVEILAAAVSTGTEHMLCRCPAGPRRQRPGGFWIRTDGPHPRGADRTRVFPR